MKCHHCNLHIVNVAVVDCQPSGATRYLCPTCAPLVEDMPEMTVDGRYFLRDIIRKENLRRNDPLWRATSTP